MRISQSTIDEVRAVSEAHERERKELEDERNSHLLVMHKDPSIKRELIVFTAAGVSDLRVAIVKPNGTMQFVWEGRDFNG